MPIAPKRKITGSSFPVLQPGNVPIVRSGSWHTLPPYGAAGSATVPDGRLFALPFWPGRRCACLGVTVNVTVIAAGGTIRVGLYASAQGLPTVLVDEYGTVASGVLGLQTIAGFSTPMEPDLHFLAVARQGGLLNLGLSSRDTWDPIVSELSPVLTGNLNCYYRDGVGGALPAMFGDVVGSVQGPSAAVQLT